MTPGTKLGPYEILGPLGAGGMGEVYRARDTRLDRVVAVKVLPGHLSENPNLRQRFEREARAVSSLNHPHICTLHDIGSQDGIDFLVMEYLEGETLAERLRRGPLPIEDLLRIGIQITDGLDRAHRQGVVHRDLKPGNVMLTKGGAKLLDFGLAKSTAASGSGAGGLTASPTLTSPLTAHGTIVGTFQYMAPEVLDGNEADARSDIFALGSVLYEMATGRPAFEGKTQASLIAAILKEEPRPIASFQPASPAALDRLLRTCLAKDPEARPQSVHDVLLGLKWIAEAGSQAGAPVAVATPGRSRARAAWVAAAALLLVAVALGVAWFSAASIEAPVVQAFIPPPEGMVFHLSGFRPGPAALSPDGRLIAFVAGQTFGKEQVWIRPVDSVVPQALAGTEGAAYPFWSPDSRTIAYFAEGKLKKIAASGGPPLTLCDAPNGKGGSWSSEGVILFTPLHNTGIFRIPETGGQAAEITKLDPARGDTSHRFPWFLPDGRRFLYLARVAGRGAQEGHALMTASLDAKEPRVLMPASSNVAYGSGHLFFMREDTLMAQPFDPDALASSGEAFPIAEHVWTVAGASVGVFSVSQSGLLIYQVGGESAGNRLVWTDRGGKSLGTLGEVALHFDPRISPDGQKVLVSIDDPKTGASDLWIYDVRRGLRSRFTFDPAEDEDAVWSPDGRTVVFASDRKGDTDREMYVKSVEGTTDEELLLEVDQNLSPTDWSRDGRHIAFDAFDPTTGTDVLVLPFTGDRKVMPIARTSFNERNGRFSPDGRWIAYISSESGKDELYVTRFPDLGRKWQVSQGEAVGDSQWRADGREIVYGTQTNELRAVEVDGRGATFLVGQVKVLVAESPAIGADLTRDGQKFLIVSSTEVQKPTPLTLVVNWPALLKSR